MEMELHYHFVRYTSSFQSHHRLGPIIDKNAPGIIRDLSLKRITSPKLIPAIFVTVNCRQSMATKNDLPETVNEEKQEKGEKILTPPPPLPPEKPEPGDCCGSGCVRCVWDVYYEELEAYNKLYKLDSNFSSS